MTTAVFAAGAFRLINHQQSLQTLLATMKRVAAAAEPEEFISQVSNAYHAVTADSYEEIICDLFRASGSHENFRAVLQAAKARLPEQIRVLNIGCGTGYDLEVLQEVFARPQIQEIVCSDISPDMLKQAKLKSKDYPCRFMLGYSFDMLSAGPFDLVITHSLVHHIPSLSGFFQDIQNLVTTGGMYVMGHEPNRHYWLNAECKAVREQMTSSLRQKRSLATLLSPTRYWNKLQRMLGLLPNSGIYSQTNDILLKAKHIQSPLTEREIQRLVDIHVPVDTAGTFNIGYEGFDCQELHRDYLTEFQQIAFHTSGYLGHYNPARHGDHWQRENQRLAQKYPNDGSVFSTAWQKQV
jgi:2-polyprenyl-3-methyl-5-hydroxy-6-metoxy-1,4-benzoquinol methylase